MMDNYYVIFNDIAYKIRNKEISVKMTKTKVVDMTVAEMKSRLDAGYAPIDVSIEKWTRRLKLDEDDWTEDCNSCALCHVYGGHCYGCPLDVIGDNCCDYESSFYNAEEDKDAQIMLDALFNAKEFVEKEKCKEPEEKGHKFALLSERPIKKSGLKKNTIYFYLADGTETGDDDGYEKVDLRAMIYEGSAWCKQTIIAINETSGDITPIKFYFVDDFIHHEE